MGAEQPAFVPLDAPQALSLTFTLTIGNGAEPDALAKARFEVETIPEGPRSQFMLRSVHWGGQYLYAPAAVDQGRDDCRRVLVWNAEAQSNIITKACFEYDSTRPGELGACIDVGIKTFAELGVCNRDEFADLGLGLGVHTRRCMSRCR